MAKARSSGERALKIISSQAPIGYRATLSGISGGPSKKKKKAGQKKKSSKKSEDEYYL